MFDRTKELVALVGITAGQKRTQHSRVVKPKVDLLAVLHLYLKKVPQVCSQFLEVSGEGQEHAPILPPTFEDERGQQHRILVKPNQVGRNLREFVAFLSLVK